MHWGHIKLLKRAKELGNHLIVALSTDEFNALKGKCSFYNYEERKFMLQAVKYVDEIIPEESWEQKEKDILNKNVDIFVMGDDWKGKFDYLNKVCKVIYLPRTAGISTTQIKRNLLLERNQRKIEND